MANQWFKFYGGEYLSDQKIERLTPTERSCWLTLLCLASMNESGVIKHLTVKTLLNKSGVQFDEHQAETWEESLGVLEKFEMLEMIERLDVNTIAVKNWNKRQDHNLTPAERMAKMRANKKDVTTNVTNVTLEENRIEENRIDKNIKGGVPYSEVFERFWLAYPEKIGKGKAYDSWKKISLPIQELCIQVIQSQVSANHFRGKDGVDYIPHPTTWLNQKRWEDEVKVKVDINKPKYIDLTKKM